VVALLLLLFSILASSSMGVFCVLLRRIRLRTVRFLTNVPALRWSSYLILWPGCWVAVKTRNPRAVQAALGLRNSRSCSWLEGLATEGKVFITPPIKGWTLVTGTGLPEPSDDIDACFRFVVDLSRKLGRVQFFNASRFSKHHAWVDARNGRVVRAYAWAGKTLWNQGRETGAEKELDLKCYGCTEAAQQTQCAETEQAARNVERVPMLAARWGFDPSWIDERSIKQQGGMVGELPPVTGEASKRRR